MKSRPMLISLSTAQVRRLMCKLLFALFVLTASAVAQSNPDNGAQKAGDDVPEANPARPTVATPATLTPVGYLQFENGILYTADSLDFSSRFAINQVTKLTVHPRLQFIVGSEPLVHSGLGPVKEFNPGGVLVGLQAVVLPGHEKRPTVALSYFKSVYAGTAPDLDIGSLENGLILLISGDVAGFHFDLNGFFNEQSDSGVRRAQFAQTISISHPVKKKFTIAGELFHFTQPLIQGNAVGNLWSVSYQVRPNLVVDTGFNRGLTSTSTQWGGFVGFTYLLPHRLWKAGDHAATKK